MLRDVKVERDARRRCRVYKHTSDERKDAMRAGGRDIRKENGG